MDCLCGSDFEKDGCDWHHNPPDDCPHLGKGTENGIAMDKRLRDIYDKAIQQERDKQDRTKALMRDLEDAQKDFQRAKDNFDFLRMAQAQVRVDDAKAELGKMYPQD